MTLSDLNYNYLANQIILLFNNGRPNVDVIDEREVEAMVKEAHALVGRQQYFENYKAENQSTVNGEWLVTYEIPLLVDSATGYKKAPLVENFLPLPKNRGVVRVSVADANYKKKRQLAFISLENYENLKNGSTIQFTGDHFYSMAARTVYVLPACGGQAVNITNVRVTQAVANDATLNEAHAMLIISQVMPLMNVRFGRKADMTSDANPNISA